MPNITYGQARKDHEYLWETYGPADDMTGAYVDQDDLAALLRKPTKATARDCYCFQIDYWFQKGTDPVDGNAETWSQDPEVWEIAERHCMLEHAMEISGVLVGPDPRDNTPPAGGDDAD